MSNPMPSDDVATVSSPKQQKEKKAGLWSVVLMTLGIQFAGTVSHWNEATRDGLGNVLQATVVMGCMYLLLAMCFAELSSIVAFAGGSFGYCRAALGPFWGFMVGASEMLQNFLFVTATVMTLSTTCTEFFDVSGNLEPLWMALAYAMIFGVHLRGGMLFWYTVMVSGGVTVLLIVMFCCGAMKTINVEKYALPDGMLFRGGAHQPVESLYFCAWFYIGLEIVPQTCEHVKNVSKHLTRGMVYSTAFTMVIALWVVMAATCNYPGISSFFYHDPFALQEIFQNTFGLPDRGSVFVSLMPLLSSAIGFMWGCGYQVAALARSGLLPSVFAKAYGENETPYVALATSIGLQYVLCIVLWLTGRDVGPQVLYDTVMLGASSVYFAMFAAFIIFRVRFESMKRNWVSPAGVPGAVVGMFLAALLFISASAYQPSKLCMAVYFPWMVVAGVYYMAYAQHTQYFSAEEQMKFMKAYILNANKSKGRGRSATSSSSSSFYRFLEPLFVPVSRMFGISASMSRARGGSSLSGSQSGTSASSSPKHASPSPKHSRPSPKSQSANKLNSVSPVEVSVPILQEPSTLMASFRQMSARLNKSSMVAPDAIDEELAVGAVSSAKEEQVQPAATTAEAALGAALSTSVRVPGCRMNGNGGLRSSFLSGSSKQFASSSSSKSTRVGWSGKVMTMSESKKFFDVLTTRDTTDENVAEKLIEALPNQFVALSHHSESEQPVCADVDLESSVEVDPPSSSAPVFLESAVTVLPAVAGQ